MDIGSIFLIVALAILVALYITRPLTWQKTGIAKNSQGVTQDEQELSYLLAERDRTLTALQELDFDFVLGKIPQEDYPTQRTALLQRGAGILRQLDQAQQVESELQADERVETILAERRLAQAPANGRNGNTRPPDDPVETLIASRRRNRQEKASGFCHKCGGPLQKSDRFCPKCGAAIG